LGVKLGLATEEVTQDVLEFLVNRSDGNGPPDAGNVVITRQMKRWHALHTLEVVYRDAFNNQLNDRYKAKFFEYKKQASQVKAQTFQFGVGLVTQAVPVAEAPQFGFVMGSFEATTYFARVAWVGASGQEGLASEVTSYDAPAGSVPVVTAVNAPANATGFNVYMGLTPETLAKQNASPVAVGGSFTLAPGGLIAGAAPGDGQVPDLFLAGTRALRRG
jgi:hypothetical protein